MLEAVSESEDAGQENKLFINLSRWKLLDKICAFLIGLAERALKFFD